MAFEGQEEPFSRLALAKDSFINLDQDLLKVVKIFRQVESNKIR